VFFDEAGEIVDVVRLTPYGDGGNFYYQIDEPIYHTLRVRSDSFVFHESTTGPFDPAATTPAPWAPAEGDEAAVQDYLAALDTRLIDRNTDA
jgi:cupin fold WbuC family metalloprotein